MLYNSLIKKTLLSTAIAMSLLSVTACDDDDNDYDFTGEEVIGGTDDSVDDTTDEDTTEDDTTDEDGNDEDTTDDNVIDETMTETKSISEVLAENENFSTLNAAINASSYKDALSSGEYTVFAPTNTAFEALLDELDKTAEELLADKDELDAVLGYHVISGKTVKAADIPFGDSIETVNKQAFSINEDNVITDASGDTSDIVDADNVTTNGVIHVIDDVLVPADKNLVGLAMASDNLSILKEAVVAAGLADTLASDDANLTVFAPTNDAFSQLLDKLEMTKEELLKNKDLLKKVLTYHVIDDRIFASEIQAGTQETLLDDSVITFTEDNKIQDAAGNTINITLADQQATNGVVHIIDSVMLPPSGS